MVEMPATRASASAIPGTRASLLPAIAVSATPITFREWQYCVDDGGCGGYRPDTQGWPEDTPAVNVSFDDARNYIAWLSRKTGSAYRLVREDEWARLALGGATTQFPWGEALGKGRTNCLECGSQWDGKRASPVRSFPANGFGLFDMVGNVAHWTQDPAPSAQAEARKCEGKQSYAAIYGASWADPSQYLATDEWACFPRILRDDTIGFRVVKVVHVEE